MLSLLVGLSLASTLDLSGTLMPVTTTQISNGFGAIVAPQAPAEVAVVFLGDAGEMSGIDFWHEYGCVPGLGWPTIFGRVGGIGGIWTIHIGYGKTRGYSYTEEVTMGLTLGSTSSGSYMSLLLDNNQGGLDWGVFSTSFSLPTTTTTLGSVLLEDLYGMTPGQWTTWASSHSGQASGNVPYDGANPSDVGDFADQLPDGFPGKAIVKAVASSMQAVKDLADFLRGNKTLEDAKNTKGKLEDDKNKTVKAIGDALKP